MAGDVGSIPEDPLEEGTATHSSMLAWEIPWTEEPGGLQSMGSQRVRHRRAHTRAVMVKGFRDSFLWSDHCAQSCSQTTDESSQVLWVQGLLFKRGQSDPQLASQQYVLAIPMTSLSKCWGW